MRFSSLLVANYRRTIGSTIGLRHQVTTAFRLKAPPSDHRGRHQVTTHNSRNSEKRRAGAIVDESGLTDMTEQDHWVALATK